MRELGILRHDLESEDIYPAQEGELNLHMGQIGSGKSYGCTAEIHELVAKGALVYATWPIHLEEFDDRESFFHTLKNLLLGRKRFYKVNCPKNFHYINAETGEVDGVYTFNPVKTAYRDEYIEYLNSLNHCHLYIDEAWRVIDSYAKTSAFTMESRNLILVTRHKFRVVNLIAQRAMSIQITARANMNRFYKYVKIANWPWVRFRRYEFQEMTGETVDENADPISIKTYWGNRKIFNSYNSYYYGDLNPLHKKFFEVYELDWKEKLLALYRILLGKVKKTELSTGEKTLQNPF